MREWSGRQDVPERSGPNGLARRASEASATTESGGEAEPQDGSVGLTGWARAAQLAEPERASHSVADARAENFGRSVVFGSDFELSGYFELSDRFCGPPSPGFGCVLVLSGNGGFPDAQKQRERSMAE